LDRLPTHVSAAREAEEAHDHLRHAEVAPGYAAKRSQSAKAIQLGHTAARRTHDLRTLRRIACDFLT
jgi:predicted transcriptional regulator